MTGLYSANGAIDVHSVADFDRAVSTLSARGRRLVYRGQTRDYGTVIPSALRPNAASTNPKVTRFFDLFLSSAQQKWEAEYYGQIYYKPNTRDFYGLMQHYWFPTEYLDVTYEPHIALWFATHEFVFLRNRCGKYVPAALDRPAIVYAFDPIDHLHHLEPRDDRSIRAIDLAEAPDAFSYHCPGRLKAQKAALLTGASSRHRDLASHVVARLHIHAEIRRDTAWSSLAERYCVERLFYDDDEFYRILMFYNRTYLDETLVLIENRWMANGIIKFWESRIAEELREDEPRNLFKPSVPWW